MTAGAGTGVDDALLWTALVTPMEADGSIDYESLGALLEEQDRAGNGILVLGSTGEALNLGEARRRAVLDFALDRRPGVPVMVGVGGAGLDETREWVAHLDSRAGVHAHLLVVPLYAKPGAVGQAAWFRALMDASPRPAMLYNVPSRTGAPLDHAALRALAGHPRLWAVKEASGSTEEFARYAADAPSARMCAGDDGMMPALAPLGARALVSVASNVWPRATGEYVRRSLAGTLSDGDRELWGRACAALFSASNPVPVKALLARVGKIRTAAVRPPLSEEDMTGLSAAVEAHGEVSRWFADARPGEAGP